MHAKQHTERNSCVHSLCLIVYETEELAATARSLWTFLDFSVCARDHERDWPHFGSVKLMRKVQRAAESVSQLVRFTKEAHLHYDTPPSRDVDDRLARLLRRRSYL